MKVNPCKAVLAPRGTTWQRLDNSRRDFTEEQPNTEKLSHRNTLSFKIISLFFNADSFEEVYILIYIFDI